MDRAVIPAISMAAPPPARLEPDAIGVAQDTIIGMASAAPAASLTLTLALLVSTTAYGTGPVIVLTAIPMLIIANAYRRLNMWNANCGASFEWVGRAVSPYLGFLAGWLMIAAYVISSVSCLESLGPSVLLIFGRSATDVWANVGIATVLTLVMLVIAVVGIRMTARTQVAMAFAEYAILAGVAIAGLVLVLRHHPGTVPFTRGWLSPRGLGGHGMPVQGFLLAVFLFTGWDGTVYVNEEVRHRRKNPGRAAVLAVLLLTVIYTVTAFGLQGVVSNGRLRANAAAPLYYIAGAVGGGTLAKLMAFALALSVIATTLAGLVLAARIVYGMASYRVLPEILGNVSSRYATPVAASIAIGLITMGLTWAYLLADSLQNAFNATVAASSLLYAMFYILTALTTIVYYRRRLRRLRDATILGVLPLAAAGFLGWVVVRSMMTQAMAMNWSIIGVAISGVVVMLAARLMLRSGFFSIPRESETQRVSHRRR